MKLSELAAKYIAHKQSMGMRFCTEARTLKSFCRSMGDIAMREVQEDRVHAHIAGSGPVTRFWPVSFTFRRANFTRHDSYHSALS